VLRSGCSGGDAATPVASRDDHRSPALRFHSRMSLPPRALLAAEDGAVPQAGFFEPSTPPPRPLA
jgi:hypothetical protein